MSYADSLRQQAKWIREALDPATPDAQRIDLGDIDVEELEMAAEALDRLGAVKDAAGDLTALWQAQKVAGLPRSERNSAIEESRERLIKVLART